jgi:3-(3-hydroxy-phenyl)propionate hydroxylase
VLFAGDAAHLVSPFGARGANSGVQDADNLVWKLKLVIEGVAPERLLDSYDVERIAAADENIRNSTRSTDFITPKSSMSRTFRDAVLSLAKQHAFARRLVNSGRLSVPSILTASPLNTPDRDHFAGPMVPGAPAADAPVRGPGSKWFVDYLGGAFMLIAFGDAVPARAAAGLLRDRIPCRVAHVGTGAGDAAADSQIGITDSAGLLAKRYDARPGTCYLFRPDQHVCARWRSFDPGAVRAAIARATGNE